MTSNRVLFRQNLVIRNYNRFAKIFRKLDFRIKTLNKTGICEGLTNNYILYATQNRCEEFLGYLNFIASLTNEKIEFLINKYQAYEKEYKEQRKKKEQEQETQPKEKEQEQEYKVQRKEILIPPEKMVKKNGHHLNLVS